MGSNSFGRQLTITTFGESHGPGIGVVIDGFPAGWHVDLAAIQMALDRRAPGRNQLTSPRQESDQVTILSGLFEEQTTGAPITLWIENRDQRSKDYSAIKDLKRPGHANASYIEKYGIFDYRGGGRASARETAARVAAGALAKQWLAAADINILAYLKSVGHLTGDGIEQDITSYKNHVMNSQLFCVNHDIESQCTAVIEQAKNLGDSIGGLVGFIAEGVPSGLGEPIYHKLEAALAYAMLSIPASKGFEIGSGFQAASLSGSQHNDCYLADGTTATNHAGGVLGGISTGMPVYGSVAFKPTSSIKQKQQTTTLANEPAQIAFNAKARHDPCVAIRAVPVVEAMLSLVLADCLLLKRMNKS